MCLPRCGAFLLPSDKLGGAERVTCNLVATLIESDCLDEAHIFILARRAEIAPHLAELRNSRRVTVIYGGRREILGVFPLLAFFLRRRYHLVFSSFTHLNALASISRRLGILRTDRLVTRESTLIFERKFNGLKQKMLRWMYRLYGAQDLLIMQTEQMRRSLIKHRPHLLEMPVEVIPNPVVLPSRALQPEDRQIDHIVWCGRLGPVKRPELAIELMQRITANFVLHFVGDGPAREHLEKLVKRCGLEKRVNFWGFVERPGSIFKKAQYGLLTSPVEGFPNVVLEMLAHGVKGVAVTPCTTGLVDIPGIHVANSHSLDDLEEVFREMREAEDRPEEISRMLHERSPQFFAEKVLGELTK